MPQRHRPSQLDPYRADIRALAAQGLTCPAIVQALHLPVHAEQLRRYLHQHGIPLLAQPGAQPGPQHGAWQGGRRLDSDGYVLVYAPQHPAANGAGYVREHRLVMEQHLGRYLEPHEVVHHINGDKADNRIENLTLFASNADHLRAELTGKRPHWTPDGWQRILDGGRHGREVLQSRTPMAAEAADAGLTPERPPSASAYHPGYRQTMGRRALSGQMAQRRVGTRP